MAMGTDGRTESSPCTIPFCEGEAVFVHKSRMGDAKLKRGTLISTQKNQKERDGDRNPFIREQEQRRELDNFPKRAPLPFSQLTGRSSFSSLFWPGPKSISFEVLVSGSGSEQQPPDPRSIPTPPSSNHPFPPHQRSKNSLVKRGKEEERKWQPCRSPTMEKPLWFLDLALGR